MECKWIVDAEMLSDAEVGDTQIGNIEISNCFQFEGGMVVCVCMCDCLFVCSKATCCLDTYSSLNCFDIYIKI